ncbi:MAG: spondin domain-containing protein [Phycisphaerales bacterium]
MNTKTITVAALALAAASATAQPVEIRVDIENLAPQNSVAFAPLRVGFHNGTYDAFNNGESASDAIISIAEGGSGDAWFPAFAAADPTATLGSVLTDGGGPLTPGATGSATFTIDPAINRYFTFGSMVVPSNDSFIGNDSPTQYQLLDSSGNLLISEIVQTGNDIWDAGSEVNGLFGSAFLQGQSNPDRIAEDGVVSFDFSQFDIYNGQTTGAGYTFDRQFGGDDALYRISFSVVPAPAGTALLGLGGLVAIRRRR